MIRIHGAHQRKGDFYRPLGKRYRSFLLLGIILILSVASHAQVDTAFVSGVITDQSGGSIIGAEVHVTNSDTDMISTGTSNRSGVYVVTGLRPGCYGIKVTKDGFKGIDLTDLILNVQDSVSRNFTLQVGSTSESVSVEGNSLEINTQSASVSTVVDRQFAENLPMNGRSFQTLIQLTPGVVLTPNTGQDGQFSVNGQRTLGGTNSLLSVNALQEFRMQTSTYAPEFGRTPGGQISIVTRSGTNQFHGTVFGYFRNDVLDANDWFADSVGLPKPRERQNDFGGTVSGIAQKMSIFRCYDKTRRKVLDNGSAPMESSVYVNSS